METWIIVIISVVVGIGLLLLAILLPLSFQSLEPNEVGLDYDKVNHNIDTSKLYEEGRHYLGVGHEFKIFPYRSCRAINPIGKRCTRLGWTATARSLPELTTVWALT